MGNWRCDFVAQEGAIYPYNSANAEDLSTVILPDSYGSIATPYTPSTNMPMLASILGTMLNFKHLAGVAAFPIANIPTNASKFVFIANGKKITGDFAITADGDGENKIINNESSDADNQSVSIIFRNFDSVPAEPKPITNGFPIRCVRE